MIIATTWNTIVIQGNNSKVVEANSLSWDSLQHN